ncbi:hypothetical protein [Ciceribacter sp. L1K22]|uniref:hypothetical protein n=1 Tax=Ciceribacter sp. L1K22 TaxID=2820275 RepID=UPI001ABDDE04|nr:hypothetical protein [Ciceribacter sp. L1K22]MBO3760379.1 hypothetical protein [Ciceribacter sp. L1K22]
MTDDITARDEDVILKQIEAFLSKTGMGASYFGRVAVGNTEVVQRLRDGRSITMATARKLREYMAANSGEAETEPQKGAA